MGPPASAPVVSTEQPEHAANGSGGAVPLAPPKESAGAVGPSASARGVGFDAKTLAGAPPPRTSGNRKPVASPRHRDVLVFESRFESANLRRAVQVANHEYACPPYLPWPLGMPSSPYLPWPLGMPSSPHLPWPLGMPSSPHLPWPLGRYDLILRPDLNTRGHTQWFYFGFANAQRGVTYKFNILNMVHSSAPLPPDHSPC